MVSDKKWTDITSTYQLVPLKAKRIEILLWGRPLLLRNHTTIKMTWTVVGINNMQYFAATTLVPATSAIKKRNPTVPTRDKIVTSALHCVIKCIGLLKHLSAYCIVFIISSVWKPDVSYTYRTKINIMLIITDCICLYKSQPQYC